MFEFITIYKFILITLKNTGYVYSYAGEVGSSFLKGLQEDADRGMLYYDRGLLGFAVIIKNEVKDYYIDDFHGVSKETRKLLDEAIERELK